MAGLLQSIPPFTIKTFCKLNGFPFSRDSDLVNDIQNVIKDSEHVFTINSVEEDALIIIIDPTVCNSFVSYHRNYIARKDMDMQSIENTPAKKIILYFVHLLKYQHQHYNQDNPVTLFYPVPVQSVKRLSMEIDPEILYHMLNEISDNNIHYNNITKE